jgi:hypothetical protein
VIRELLNKISMSSVNIVGASLSKKQTSTTTQAAKTKGKVTIPFVPESDDEGGADDTDDSGDTDTSSELVTVTPEPPPRREPLRQPPALSLSGAQNSAARTSRPASNAGSSASSHDDVSSRYVQSITLPVKCISTRCNFCRRARQRVAGELHLDHELPEIDSLDDIGKKKSKVQQSQEKRK